jgi:hypothetical protein
MKTLKLIALFTLSFVSLLQGEAGQIREVGRQEYLAYMRAAAEDGWNAIDADRIKYRNSIDLNYVFGYAPPGNEPYLAALCANLYEITKEELYLDRAKELLLYYGKHRDAYPPDFAKSRSEYGAGIPALPNIFTFQKYCHAYEILKKYRKLSAAEKKTIDDNIAGSADFFCQFQEWGAMNRAMLRVEGLLYAARTVPDHPHRRNWTMIGEAIAGDNWDEWEIEDATGYNAIWLYALLGYASDVRQDESFYRRPTMQYYFEYFLQLMCPAGVIPDVGDANWGTGWDRMIPFFEKGAAVNRDPRLRWAAARIFRKYCDPLPERRSVFIGLVISDAYRWTDFSLPATEPASGSQQVLDDMVGKKVVFRDGWGEQGTYMLYNYRDEGDGGWLFREGLRNSIPVEEEKMTHGHSDENSIALLMHNGSILLHDGGYRDYMPSGPYGAFRADYFHNRLVVRNEKIALGQHAGQYRYASPQRDSVAGQSMLDFFRNSGAYRNIRTQKVDFLAKGDYELSRTRLIDADWGYEAERAIVFVKPLDWFVVFDAVRFTRPGYLTMANLWHTRKILAQGPGWYDTAYDSLTSMDVRGSERLLVVFPQRAQMEEGVAQEQRYYQREQAIYQMIGRHGYLNDMQTFVTVLIPHDASTDPRTLLDRIQRLPVEEMRRTLGITLTSGETSYSIGMKMDCQADLFRDWRRPMYSVENGKVKFGDFTTDAMTFFATSDQRKIHYAMVVGSMVSYKGHVLHEQGPEECDLAFDGSRPQPGVFKLRYWEGETPR